MTRKRFQSGLLTTLLILSVVAGAVPFADTAAASLGGATATDVGVGQRTVTQTISIVGQTPNSGKPDVYEIDVSDAVNSGVVVTNAEFEDVPADDDTLERGPEYHSSDEMVTLAVSDGTEGDNKVTFDVKLTLDTSGATPGKQLRYQIRQYDSANRETTQGSQNPQFDLFGTDDLSATTSDDSADAGGVTHTFTLSMTGDMNVETVVVETPGADYGNVASDDIELSAGSKGATIDSVSGIDGKLTISLGGLSLDDGDTITLDVTNAKNPGSTVESRLSFANDEMEFTDTDAIVLQRSPDDSSSNDGRTSTPGSTDGTYISDGTSSPHDVAEIVEFGLRSADGDVELVLVSTETLENITADVSGDRTTTLVRSNFKLKQEGDYFRYVANLDANVWGTYSVRLEGAESTDGDVIDGGQETDITITRPAVERFELVATGRDVDLIMRLDSRVESATVELGNEAVGTLHLSDFVRRQDGGQYVYRANVVSGHNGQFEATLTSLNGLTTDDGTIASDTLTVDIVSARANAVPDAAGASARHQYAVTVPPGAAAARSPLTSFVVAYPDLFVDADGQVSSVSASDVTLRVLSPNGTTETILDGSDGLSITVDDGEIRADLSSVDQSVRPTLDAYDRVRITIGSVDNADRRDDYSVDVRLVDADGGTTDAETRLGIDGQGRQQASNPASPTTPASTARAAMTVTPISAQSSNLNSLIALLVALAVIGTAAITVWRAT